MSTIEFHNFTELSLKDKEIIFSWRNSLEVKKWMLTSDTISLSNHLKFIESLKSNKDRLYFLLKNSTQSLGVISFIEITQSSCFLGIYKNPSLRGVGEILLNSLIKYAFKELSLKHLTAQVFADNTKALTLYTKHNFLENSREIYINKELINMELKYENWQV